MSSKQLAVWVGLIVLVTAAAYIPAMRGGFVWDDDDYLLNNPHLRSVEGLRRIWLQLGATTQYYPLVYSSYWVEYHLWGLRPFGYHATNVLGHALNAALLGLLLRRLRVPGALVAAAVFALHPVHVESVAWITERKNVFSGFFCLSAALAYLRWAAPEADTPRPRSHWLWYGAALLLFAGGMLSKTTACVLPPVLVLLLWWRRDRLGWRDGWALAPFFVLAVALGLVTVWVEKHHVGASGEPWSLSFCQRVLLAGRALWFYAGKLLWPQELIFVYSRWRLDPHVGWQWLYPLGAGGVAAVFWGLRHRVGKGPLVACLVFGGALFPALGFFDVYFFRYSFVADHFQYLASMGLIGLATAAVARLLALVAGGAPIETQTPGVPPSLPKHAWLPAPAVLLALGALTWRQAGAYHDAETLWRDTLAKNPSAWLAHTNLGNLYVHENRLDEAVRHLRESLKIEPSFPLTHHNLAGALLQQNHLAEALHHAREAVRLTPEWEESHHLLGVVLETSGRVEEAIGEYQEAVKIRPSHCGVHIKLGNALARLGRFGEAVESYREALRLAPNQIPVRKRLAIALARAGRRAEGIAELRETLVLAPHDADAHFQLGNLWVQDGQLDAAIAEYRAALRMDPTLARARANLAEALRMKETAGSP